MGQQLSSCSLLPVLLTISSGDEVLNTVEKLRKKQFLGVCTPYLIHHFVCKVSISPLILCRTEGFGCIELFGSIMCDYVPEFKVKVIAIELLEDDQLSEGVVGSPPEDLVYSFETMHLLHILILMFALDVNEEAHRPVQQLPAQTGSLHLPDSSVQQSLLHCAELFMKGILLEQTRVLLLDLLPRVHIIQLAIYFIQSTYLPFPLPLPWLQVFFDPRIFLFLLRGRMDWATFHIFLDLRFK